MNWKAHCDLQTTHNHNGDHMPHTDDYYTTGVNNDDREANLNNAPRVNYNAARVNYNIPSYYINLPANIIVDAPRVFDNRPALNDFIRSAVNDYERASAIIDAAPQQHYDGGIPEHNGTALYNLQYGDPDFFYFKPLDNDARYDGTYDYTGAVLNNFNIFRAEHNGTRPYSHLDIYRFDHRPETCQHGCRPSPDYRGRPRSNPPGDNFHSSHTSSVGSYTVVS